MQMYSLRTLISVALFIILFALTGCSGNSNELMVTIDSLRMRVDSLEARQKSMGQLVGQIYFEQLSTRNESVTLGPTSEGFQRLDTENGFFLISVEDIQPYVNGYKLTINVGNPLQITYNGITCKLKWGRNRGNQENYEAWDALLRSRDVPVLKDILPGTWNKVDVQLVPASAEELEYINLRIETNQVGLRNS